MPGTEGEISEEEIAKPREWRQGDYTLDVGQFVAVDDVENGDQRGLWGDLPALAADYRLWPNKTTCSDDGLVDELVTRRHRRQFLV